MGFCVYMGVYRKKKVQDQLLLSTTSENQSFHTGSSTSSYSLPALFLFSMDVLDFEFPFEIRFNSWLKKEKPVLTNFSILTNQFLGVILLVVPVVFFFTNTLYDVPEFSSHT